MKQIEIFRATILLIVMVLVFLISGCSDNMATQELECGQEIEYWSDVLREESRTDTKKVVNTKRIAKIEMRIQEIRENCNY